MTEVPKLVIAVETSAHAVTSAASNWVAFVKSIQAETQRLEADLAQKRHAADVEVGRLRAEIAQLRSDREKEKRELAMTIKEKEKEKREIGMERERFLK